MIEKRDMLNINNLIKLLAKGTFQLEGATEVMAAADAMRWLSNFAKRAEEELNKPIPPVVEVKNETPVPAIIDSAPEAKEDKNADVAVSKTRKKPEKTVFKKM